MSDDDEDNFQLYGTLLDPFDEDAVPKKKAFTIEDQIATDEQGRRRFHGAFTGGFSAGFFNTVGSLEGWQPSEFKSSRLEKAERRSQKPQDFMDDEDMGEFGIAPTGVRATSDYATKTTRKRGMHEGPIPGMPVLQTLLQPVKDTVGIKLLKQMGWKPGQGVGPRLTKSEKRRMQREHAKTTGKVYGCEIPAEYRQAVPQSASSSSDEDDELTFAPDDYDPFIVEPKTNTFGMGYSGLDKRAILSSHITLFDPPEFKMRDHKNSKISVSGQAFGVGAFENEDEDIYTRDDMSKYDFQLDSFAKQKQKHTFKKVEEKPIEKILEGFVISKNPVSQKKSFPPPMLPKNFIPKHGVRLSRFEPLPETHKLYNYDRTKSMGRHDLSAAERAKIINSETVVIEKTPKTLETKVLSSAFNTPVEKEKESVVKSAAKKTQDLPSTPLNTNFKPFITDPDKQSRYEQFLTLQKLGQEQGLRDIQPASMADWEKERERYEFAQAARMFKPVTGLVFDKFVAESSSGETQPATGKTIYQHGTQDMRDAAKKKMFGPLTRTIEVWIPNKLLCRRFNVPEPDITETEMALSKKKKGKYNVFDYYEAYQENKVKEGPALQTKSDDAKTEDKTESTGSTEVAVEVTEVIEVQKEPEKVDEIRIETFKTSKEIFLEESSQSSITRTIGLSKTKPSNNTPSNSYYKKPETIEPKPVIPTDPKEKKDLFKAIFLSSSESEGEKSDNEEPAKDKTSKMDEMKKIVLEEEHTVQIDQPIINASKGIFSNLDWSKVNKNPKTTESTETKKDPTPPPSKSNPVIIDTYGPQLPTNKTDIAPKPPEWKPTFQKKSNIAKDTKESSSSSEDEWMEADSTSQHSSKTSKKHKKHKSKHKKHKSKHKKKKSKH